MNSQQVFKFSFIGGAKDSYSKQMKDVYDKFDGMAKGSTISDYYYWTGTNKNTLTSGEFEISSIYLKDNLIPHCIVGHSFGGDTAYQVCRLLGAKKKRVKLLITLDAVSPLTWIVGSYSKPNNVDHWINIWSDNKKYMNNQIAILGGRWGKQTGANIDKKVPYDHYDAYSMFYKTPIIKQKLREFWYPALNYA